MPVWRSAVALATLLLPSCIRFVPESSLPQDEPVAATVARVEAALGLEFREPATRLESAPAEVAAARDPAVLGRASPAEKALDRAVFEMLRRPDREGAPAAAARAASGHVPRVAFDPERRALLVADVPEPADPRSRRRAGLEATEACALALVDQRLGLQERLGTRVGGDGADEREALRALVHGAVHVAALEASTSPVSGFDASAAPLLRRHERMTRRLLDDPDGAPAELLAEGGLTDAEHLALERLLEVEGMERRRRILRVFGGARLLLRAKDRWTSGNLGLAFADPPLSTEQVLHPERWIDHDEAPMSLAVGRRDGLLGPGWSLVATGPAGEFGLREALAGELAFREAEDAAEGWEADALSVYRAVEGGAMGCGWRIEFADRFEAGEAEEAFLRAIAFHHGGNFVRAEDGVYELQGAPVHAVVEQRFEQLAVLIGGTGVQTRHGLSRLFGEVASEAGSEARTARHDFGYRLIRLLASPFFFDAPGRHDQRLFALLGLLDTHRLYPEGAENRVLNPGCFPLLGLLVPDEWNGLLFGVERSPFRNDTHVLGRLVRSFADAEQGTRRFWSPFWSRNRSAEHDDWGIAYGALWRHAEGAGHRAAGPWLLFRDESWLDGEVREQGVLLDAVHWRDGKGTEGGFGLLPGGALLGLSAGGAEDGFELGMLLDSIVLRARTVVDGEGHVDFRLLDGWLLRAFDDDAAGTFEYAVGKGGLLAGVHGGPRHSAGGLFRLFDRSFVGGGRQDERWFFDALWMRFGD